MKLDVTVNLGRLVEGRREHSRTRRMHAMYACDSALCSLCHQSHQIVCPMQVACPLFIIGSVLSY